MFYQKSIYWSTLGRYYSGKKKVFYLFVKSRCSHGLFFRKEQKNVHTPPNFPLNLLYTFQKTYNCAKNLMEDFGQINNSLMANFWKKYGKKRPLEKCDFSKI